ncbi:flagellar export protein FliJ [Aliiglaciecola sp. CAU 1673]|uniref:flagellar export protein FliJ n=1 Tax=Aliiglaciecola sp. CAU 1673 TaxID=3032595 RepID=UPI0023DB82D8|nr:flagellar export protein FliJ [Aliiglaciecola sp. CAU 1673]MDF2178289.1 flagellar export protein FliJ [Aliiglaciecola sp. CAU 1673]
MSTKQLEIVAHWEKEKEDKLARDYQLAVQNVNNNQQKLSGLQRYRLDYLRELQQRAMQGVGATTFGQHQAFVEKLDKACAQQTQMLARAKAVAEQRKGLWLKQQQKRKAVEMLIDKKHQEKAQKEAKHEQAMMDEIAIQRFVRRAKAS